MQSFLKPTPPTPQAVPPAVLSRRHCSPAAPPLASLQPQQAPCAESPHAVRSRAGGRPSPATCRKRPHLLQILAQTPLSHDAYLVTTTTHTLSSLHVRTHHRLSTSEKCPPPTTRPSTPGQQASLLCPHSDPDGQGHHPAHRECSRIICYLKERTQSHVSKKATYKNRGLLCSLRQGNTPPPHSTAPTNLIKVPRVTGTLPQ